MDEETPRSRVARRAAERALVRVVHHYGSRPEFVLLGGLVPEILCGSSEHRHAGTTDVDVQVNLEIECGAVNTKRLENALRNAEFEPEDQRVWRWLADDKSGTLVKFELLADLDNHPSGATVHFDDCEKLGAANLRGTRFASRDVIIHKLRARLADSLYEAEVNVAGLGGFLLAKAAAAYSRRKEKDWYDIAFVLLKNDAGGPVEASAAVKARFSTELGSVTTALDDLRANFATPQAQGAIAYVKQMLVDYPELDGTTLAADAILAVDIFCRDLLGK